MVQIIYHEAQGIADKTSKNKSRKMKFWTEKISKRKISKKWSFEDSKVHRSNSEEYHHALSLVWSFFGNSNCTKTSFVNKVSNICLTLSSIFLCLHVQDERQDKQNREHFVEKLVSREDSRIYSFCCRQSEGLHFVSVQIFSFFQSLNRCL